MPRMEPVPTEPAPPIWKIDFGPMPRTRGTASSVRRKARRAVTGRGRPVRPQKGGSQAASHASPQRSTWAHSSGALLTPACSTNQVGNENAKSRPIVTYSNGNAATLFDRSTEEAAETGRPAAPGTESPFRGRLAVRPAAESNLSTTAERSEMTSRRTSRPGYTASASQMRLRILCVAPDQSTARARIGAQYTSQSMPESGWTYLSEEFIEDLERAISQGKTISSVLQEYGINRGTYYSWLAIGEGRITRWRDGTPISEEMRTNSLRQPRPVLPARQAR